MFLLKAKKNTPNNIQKHCCCIYQNRKIYFFGGFNGFNYCNDLYIFDGTKIEECFLHDILIKKIINNLRHSFNNKYNADVIIRIKNKQIYAHKKILIDSSSHFRLKFLNVKNNLKKIILDIKDYSYEAYIKMIEYIYLKKVKDISKLSISILIELTNLSSEYLFPELTYLCIRELINKIDIQNVCFLLHFSLINFYKDLSYMCLRFIKKYYQYVMLTDDYFQMVKKSPFLAAHISKLTSKKIT